MQEISYFCGKIIDIMKKGIFLYCLFALFFVACNENAPEGGEGGTTPLQPGEITWKFVPATNTLIISGDGAMANYATPADAPWYKYAEYVTDVIIEEGVTSVGKHAFKEYIHISKVTLPSTLKVIERSAFEGCTSLSDIDLSETALTSIGNRAFYGCTSLTNLDFSGTAVNLIDQEAFAECKALKSVAVPASLKTIGTKAFYNCQSLATLDLSKANLSTLGERAFYQCKALQKIDFSAASLTAIPLQAFCDCAALTEVVLPTRLQSIGIEAFARCKALAKLYVTGSKQDVAMPSTNFTTIDNNAFIECESLPYFSISSTVKKIGDKAFYKCKGLKNANLSLSNLTQLGKQAFEGCDDLETVSWNSKLTTAPEHAFYNCQALKTINSFSVVKTIGTGAFAKCEALDVAVPSSVVTIGDSAFFICDLTSINLPSSITTIGECAFSGCTRAALGSMKNCTKLTVIEKKVFYNVHRKSSLPDLIIELPSSIKTIKDYAFYDAGYVDKYEGHLKKVICHATTPPTLEGDDIFHAYYLKNYYYTTLYVPSASVSAYKASNWTEYFDNRYHIEAL